MRKVKPLPLARALGVIAQMTRALGAAHDKGIVHRDLKPDNVFLVQREGREDFVKIVDFGIAKVQPREDSDEARLTQVGTVFGTPEYMSPEQASGRTDVDSRADIYAVGIILYEMLVGHVPHKGSTTVRTLAMQILDDPIAPRVARPELEITQDLEDVVLRALEKNRDKRFATMKDLLTALEEVTSKTELDLPLLLKQERISAAQIHQLHSDTVPEVNVPSPGDSSDSAIGTIRPSEMARNARATGSTRSRRRSRVTDPVFLRTGSATSVPTFDPIESLHTGEYNASSGKKHLGIILVVTLLVCGGVAAFILTRSETDKRPMALATMDAATPTPLLVPPDAAILPAIIDAGIPLEIRSDARGRRRRNPNRDDSSKPLIVSPNPDHTKRAPLLHGDIEVTIITKPRGGRLLIDKTYAGSDGLNLRRKAGTDLTVHCRKRGYLDGTVRVRFDGIREVFLCKLGTIRTKRCVKGLKSPFDACP